MKKEQVALAVLGTGVGVWVLSKVGKAAPPNLVQAYLRDIAACNTLEALASVRTRFEADYAALKLTEPEYQQVYAAYVVRYDELNPGMTTLDFRAVKPDALMPNPTVSVDGNPIGTVPALWQTNPGTYTVTWQDKPGGDNPAPGVAYYQAPEPQTVTVEAGQTLTVTGTYTIVPYTPADVLLSSFGIGAGPFEPGSQQLASLVVTNPTDRAIQYEVWAYPSDPTGPPESPNVGAIGGPEVFSLQPGGQGSYQMYLTMPGQEGTYGIWLRFYEQEITGYSTFIKKVNSGRSVLVQVQGPPPPVRIEDQLASIISPIPYLLQCQLYRSGAWHVYVWPPSVPPNDLTEIYPGEMVYLQVLQACPLTYGGKTYNLVAGWNMFVW